MLCFLTHLVPSITGDLLCAFRGRASVTQCYAFAFICFLLVGEIGSCSLVHIYLLLINMCLSAFLWVEFRIPFWFCFGSTCLDTQMLPLGHRTDLCTLEPTLGSLNWGRKRDREENMVISNNLGGSSVGWADC